ncbi:hypothetical protein NP493_183g00014 [Ridgeia piscesae]|uniref:Major facilitator superfamily (MFS) profile domain-containing protein n=1 Tax=Ridgeia piscesae TaxID=27915 RepID=A0AAD9P2H7_RIDPI|nr:hypothetical protein NP493_183g00014 [Ridgeia piscesae]
MFLAIHMKQLGLTASETSVIMGVTTLVGAVTRTAIGVLADKLRRHKELLIVCTLATAVIHCFLLLVPAVHNPEASDAVPVYCGTNGSYVELCRGNVSSYKDCSQTSITQMEKMLFIVFNTSQQDMMFNNSKCSLSCVTSYDPRYNSDVINEKKATLPQRLNFSVNTIVPLWDSSTRNDTICHRYVLSSVDVVGEGRDVTMTCNKPVVLLCAAKCELFGSLHFSRCLNDTSSEEVVPFARTFWLYMLIFFCGQTLFSPVFGLIDAITYDYLGDERGKWGRQRLWGTLGMVTASVTSGYLMDFFSRGKDETDYTPAFVLFACMEVLCAVMAAQYRGSDNIVFSVPSFKDMKALMKRPDALMLFFVVFVAGLYSGLIESYLFWHLQTLGHAPKLLFGLCLLHNGLPEIVMLFLAGSIMKKLGHVKCLCLACAAYATRMIGYSFLSDPWMVLFIEPLQGLTFGLFYASASAYGSLITPPGLHGTVQGIIGSLHFGFGTWY